MTRAGSGKGKRSTGAQPRGAQPVRKALTADDLLSLEDAEIREVDMSKWWPGRTVFIRSMTARARDEFEASGLRKVGKGNKVRFEPTFEDPRTRLLVQCLCAEDGTLLFTQEDIGRLSVRHAGAIVHLAEIAREINGIGEGDDDEELEKN